MDYGIKTIYSISIDFIANFLYIYKSSLKLSVFFLYEMLSEIDGLRIDGGGQGHLYILDKKEEFLRKIRIKK